MKMVVERGPFIDHSESLNICITEPTYAKLTGMHMYTWRNGLKTSITNLSMRNAAPNRLDAEKPPINEMSELKVNSPITSPNKSSPNTPKQASANMVCSLNNPDNCESCGS